MENRKIPQEIENPVDNVLIKISEFLSPYFKKINFTANGITTLSLISGLFSFCLYVNKSYTASAILFLLQYFFDCMDGYYARRYKITSQFGDYYDHLKDLLIILLFGYAILSKYLQLNTAEKYLPFIIIIFLLISEIHLGCQEIYYNKDSKETADMLKMARYFCPYEDKKDLYNFMTISRFAGTGTLTLFTVFLILYSYVVDKHLSAQ